MKNFKLILVTCFCIFFFTISCDKEIINNSATPNLAQTRANVAAKLRTDIDKNFLNYDFAKYNIAPLWDLSVVQKNKKSLEVPYTINNKLIMPRVSNTLKGRQRLLLTLNGSKVTVTIIQYIPDLSFRGNIGEVNAENFKQKKFNGRVVFQKIGEEEKTIWELENGKVSKKLYVRKKTPKNLRPSDYWACTIYSQDTDWYQWNSQNEEWYYTNTTTEISEECEYIVENNDPPYDPYDCNNNPSWPWCGDPCSNGRAYPCGGGEEDNAPKPVWANESQLKSKLCVTSNAAFHQIKTQMINDWRAELNAAGIYDLNPDIGYDSKTNKLMFKSVSNSSNSMTAPIDFGAYDNCP